MRREVINRVLLILGVAAVVMIAAGGIYYWKYRKIPRIVQIPIEILRSTSPDWEKPGKYWETSQYHTPNLHEGKNEVKAIVLHHTASKGTGELVAKELCRPNHGASCHVVIDTDGTRYVLAQLRKFLFMLVTPSLEIDFV